MRGLRCSRAFAPLFLTLFLFLGSFVPSALSSGTTMTAGQYIVPVTPSPASVAYDPTNHDVYVGSFTGSVSVLSGTQNIANVTSSLIGYTARALAYDPSSNEIYVAGNGVALISGTDVVGRITNGTDGVAALAYDSSNRDMYAAGLGSVEVLSGSAPVGTIQAGPYPTGLVYDPIDGAIYATYLSSDQSSASIYIIVGTSIKGNLTISGGGGFAAPAYDSCDDYVYIANSAVDSVSVLSGATIVANVGVGAEPIALAYDSLNGYVYVANFDSGTVSILNGTTAVAAVQVGTHPIALAYDAFDGAVYVVNYGSDSVSVISGTTVVGEISVGQNPIALAYDASNYAMYVANGGSSSVSIVGPLSGVSSSTTASNHAPCQSGETTSSSSSSHSATVATQWPSNSSVSTRSTSALSATSSSPSSSSVSSTLTSQSSQGSSSLIDSESSETSGAGSESTNTSDSTSSSATAFSGSSTPPVLFGSPTLTITAFAVLVIVLLASVTMLVLGKRVSSRRRSNDPSKPGRV